MTERTREDWGRAAVALPGSPAAWHRTEEFILVTSDGQHIAPDGTWWWPDADGMLHLDVDHPATAGCLLALLREGGCYIRHVAMLPLGCVVRIETPQGMLFEGRGATLGRACIAAFERLERVSGGAA